MDRPLATGIGYRNRHRRFDSWQCMQELLAGLERCCRQPTAFGASSTGLALLTEALTAANRSTPMTSYTPLVEAWPALARQNACGVFGPFYEWTAEIFETVAWAEQFGSILKIPGTVVGDLLIVLDDEESEQTRNAAALRLATTPVRTVDRHGSDHDGAALEDDRQTRWAAEHHLCTNGLEPHEVDDWVSDRLADLVKAIVRLLADGEERVRLGQRWLKNSAGRVIPLTLRDLRGGEALALVRQRVIGALRSEALPARRSQRDGCFATARSRKAMEDFVNAPRRSRVRADALDAVPAWFTDNVEEIDVSALAGGASPTMDELLVEREQHAQVEEVMRLLEHAMPFTERQRQVFEFDLAGMPTAEQAAVLSVSQSRVRSIRRQVKDRLARAQRLSVMRRNFGLA